MNKYVFLLFVSCGIGVINSQVKSLPNSWRFQTGDKPEYSNTNYNDAGWNEISVKDFWEKQGYSDYDGFAWYRQSFVADKKLLKTKLFLVIGKVDDVDETFINGVSIGKTGSFPPNVSSEWNTQRIYAVPENLLKPNNTIAIRVYDGGGPGGIYSGEFTFIDEKQMNEMKKNTVVKGQSFFNLPTTNGLIAGVYDEKTASITSIYPHIYQAIDSAKPVKAFVQNLSPISKLSPLETKYLQNTHVIRVKYKSANVYYYSSFTRNEKIFYCLVETKKTCKDGYYLQLKDSDPSVLLDSVVTEKGDKLRKYYLFSYKDESTQLALDYVEARNYCHNNYDFLENEIKYMKGIFKKVNKPHSMSKAEQDIFEQQITFLKMAQVRDEATLKYSKGQIIASLPPGIWNISWVRDASYAVRALTLLGLHEEAKSALIFWMKADVGQYKKYRHTDGKEYGINSDYKVSVCRYYGNGKEESDYNSDGPNIELDGFGLVLTAVSEYLNNSKDIAFFNEYYKTIKNRIAEALLINIDKNGLVRPESGAWERHLPGKQYSFTSITAAKGLQDWGNVLQSYKIDGGKKYSTAGKLLEDMIRSKLIVDSSFIKGCLESSADSVHEYLDASSYEYFNSFEYSPKLFSLHHDKYSKQLKLSKDRGFSRVNKGDWYDKQEWIFLDLRIASSLNKYNHFAEAKKLFGHVVKNAQLNHNIIPELYNEKTGAYEGASPMVGFGGGAYIMYLFNK